MGVRLGGQPLASFARLWASGGRCEALQHSPTGSEVVEPRYFGDAQDCHWLAGAPEENGPVVAPLCGYRHPVAVRDDYRVHWSPSSRGRDRMVSTGSGSSIS